jgi:hypothetical protein
MTNEMTKTHAAGWVRFQRALCAMGETPTKYRYIINSQRHRDAVRVLGRGGPGGLSCRSSATIFLDSSPHTLLPSIGR